MKHFIIEINYTANLEEISAVTPAHRAFLQSGYERGWLLFSGPRNPRSGGIVAARAPSLADLQAYFGSDPYHLAGLADYTFIEFDPVKHQPWLEDWVTGSDLE